MKNNQVNKFLFIAIVLAFIAGGGVMMVYSQFLLDWDYEEVGRTSNLSRGRGFISLAEADKKEIISEARIQTQNTTGEGLVFDLELSKRVEDLALVEIVFYQENGLEVEIGRAGIILERKDDMKWHMVAIDMDLSSWVSVYPQLFE